MTSSVIAWGQSWGQISSDVKLNWFIYLSMPLIAAFVGYTTKLVALQMLYRPIEFVGIGPFGWQGVVPRRAGKTAAMTIQMLTDKLLRPTLFVPMTGRDQREAKEAREKKGKP